MKIKLSNAGRRFNREWIFRGANLEFNAGQAYAITGHNGSGKSTLLQSISTMLQLSEGNITFSIGGKNIEAENAFNYISFCAPYMEVVEEMTLTEFLNFHSVFKPFLPHWNHSEIIKEVGLHHASDKQIRNFSSGMKQRVKLAQALFSDTPVVLLDEPCSNLDQSGVELYHSLIDRFCKDRLIIVCSNDPVEYRFTQYQIAITEFK
jgi:ABC-type multidrug transport system ATPase subunit